ncbi:allantoin permease [Lampropedia cohaerens]|uniref:Allantoin permease n=1 Tax=Lampropedia cohaerens TaxID=1610491 RepID=A0A0U1PZY2_9BURK|nr:cytosine permease [Lampropedia cohaerens]KKW68047.1 allantoin permease [Lampropedia cohaerens]
MKQADSSEGAFSIESNSIDYVPPEQRHGNPKDLFTLWFCTNIAPLAVITGATAIVTFRLDVVSAVLAICFGHFFGALILGLTSAQGPQVGIPQMIQSRAQFGRYGSLLVVVFTTIIYLGYFISNIILSGKTLHTVAPAIPLSAATVIGAVLATLIGVIGYNFIHRINKLGTWFMGGALLLGTAIMLPQLTPAMLQQGQFSASAWFAVFGICAVWQISFSPYTSDYSRYLPKSTGIFKPFLYTYLGAALGTICAFLFGVLAVSITDTSDAMLAVKEHTGILGFAIMVLFLANVIGHNAMNLYGAVLSCITSIQTFSIEWRPGRKARIALSVTVLIVSTWGALLASADFISIFISAVFALLFILAPWVAINLIDFYLINRAGYDIASIFARDGGVYGKFNVSAMTAYFVGIGVQLPFIRNAWFEGSWSRALGDIDVSWLVGLLVTAVVYLVLNSSRLGLSASLSAPQRAN